MELVEVKVNAQSEYLNAIISDASPLIHDRDPKRVNKNLKVTSVYCHWGLIQGEYT